MLIQSPEPIVGKMLSPQMQCASAHEIHDPPEGVSQEGVDAYTLAVIRLLFKNKGLQFLAALLPQASAKQRALPDIGVADCDVIRAKTIRELAQRISQPGVSWGYDTMQKYLTVLYAEQRLGQFWQKGERDDTGRDECSH